MKTTQVSIPAGSTLSIAVSVTGNARYSVYLFKQQSGGWQTEAIEQDGFLGGSGTGEHLYNLGNMQSAGMKWVVVISASLTAREEKGRTEIRAKLQAGNQAGDLSDGADITAGGFVQRELKFEMTSN